MFGCWTSVVAQVGAAGVRGAELRSSSTPCSTRARRVRAQRLLHRRRAEPAGDPGRRLPDERTKASSAGCSPAPTTSIRAPPTRSSRPYLKDKGVAAEDIMINYTPFGHSDWQTDRRRHQGVRLGRQEDRRGLDHQRRRQRAVLQGTRQPGHHGRGHPGRRLLGRRRRARRPRHQRRWSATSPPGTTSSPSTRRRTPTSSTSGRPSSRTTKRVTNDPMEAHYIGFNMWVKAVEKAGTTDTDAVLDAHHRPRGAEPDRRHCRRCCRTTTSPSRC